MLDYNVVLAAVPNGPMKDDLINYHKDSYHFDYNNINCHIKRNLFFSWCGYVSLPELLQGNLDCDELDVHGGITFGNGTSIGFDMAHWDDSNPSDFILMPSMANLPNKKYWNFQDAKNETLKLAKQIYELSTTVNNEELTVENEKQLIVDDEEFIVEI